jgi:hypothetical protein
MSNRNQNSTKFKESLINILMKTGILFFSSVGPNLKMNQRGNQNHTKHSLMPQRQSPAYILQVTPGRGLKHGKCS